ncbi:hypothetical protein V8N76_004582 [Salmonella enterica]
MGYLVNRLKEPSTWRGLILLLTGVFGYELEGHTQDVVIAAGVAVSGIVGAILPDRLR